MGSCQSSSAESVAIEALRTQRRRRRMRTIPRSTTKSSRQSHLRVPKRVDQVDLDFRVAFLDSSQQGRKVGPAEGSANTHPDFVQLRSCTPVFGDHHTNAQNQSSSCPCLFGRTLCTLSLTSSGTVDRVDACHLQGEHTHESHGLHRMQPTAHATCFPLRVPSPPRCRTSP